MSGGRTRLIEGERVLTDKGYALVVKHAGEGWLARGASGESEYVGLLDMETVQEVSGWEVAPVAGALRPMWDAINAAARRVALDRLEVVQEILTGYRDGLPELARDGEPHPPFGSGFGYPKHVDARRWHVCSLKRSIGTGRCSAASRQASFERHRSMPARSETG